MVSALISRARTRRGRRFLDNRKSKIVENDKTSLIVKGGKTSSAVTSALADLYLLKKPLTKQLRRRNPLHPFDDDTSIERFSAKFDCSLFLFGSHSRKRPDSLIFGRMFDSHVLDMAELRIESIVPSSEFKAAKATLGTKPCIVMQGLPFETDATVKRIGNLFVDWFRGVVVDKIRLQGLEMVISLTALQDKILFRVYRIFLKKAAEKTPRVEVLEVGPRIDFSVQRTKLASDSLFAASLKQPKQTIVKIRKNFSTDEHGTKLARIHVGKQNLDSHQTRRIKALRSERKDSAQGPTDMQE